ncbi:hypothetical protein [Mucilaginibacter hurinus]|uniref:hypothetical protein n=1 Tax=Mucilaginibacter hurinus TaxID=2201324 RepID=UPI0013149D6D|nr:hypothetical protein [Mucilaginibacter hurinus]
MKQRFKDSFEIPELLISKREPFGYDTSWKEFKRIQFLNQLNSPASFDNPTLF